jgi:hypothetical protein
VGLQKLSRLRAETERILASSSLSRKSKAASSKRFVALLRCARGKLLVAGKSQVKKNRTCA